MSVFIAISRIILPIITIYIIVKCLIALLFGRPRQNIIAHLQDTSTGEEYDLNMWESSIGRAKNCDIVVNDPSTSRFHAVIARRVNGWFVYDLISKNGIKVNGETIDKRREIENNDLITLGTSLVLRFVVDNDPIIRVSKRKLKQMQKEAEKRKQQFNEPVYVPPVQPYPQQPLNTQQPFNTQNRPVQIRKPSLISSTGKIYPLQGFSVKIGQGENCFIHLYDPQSENYHTSIDLYEDGSWVISNISRNGTTFLNGIRVKEPLILIEGDKIQVAGSTFTYTERV